MKKRDKMSILNNFLKLVSLTSYILLWVTFCMGEWLFALFFAIGAGVTFLVYEILKEDQNG